MAHEHTIHSEDQPTHVHHEQHFDTLEEGLHTPHSTRKQIWKVFFILLAITILEFLIALTPSVRNGLGKELVIAVFLGLTVLKAFYIVGYFMHLKQEKINMAYTILIPLIFIIYLIALLMFESGAKA
jgi:cytochrome c oxidase subunit IV